MRHLHAVTTALNTSVPFYLANNLTCNANFNRHVASVAPNDHSRLTLVRRKFDNRMLINTCRSRLDAPRICRAFSLIKTTRNSHGRLRTTTVDLRPHDKRTVSTTARTNTDRTFISKSNPSIITFTTSRTTTRHVVSK